jgi:hypothetical protein
MEQKASVWKANLTSGLIIGLVGIVYTLVIWFMDLTFNKFQGYIYFALLIFLLYYFIKAYRDNYLGGYITYGQAVGAGVIISLISAIVGAIFTYILYTFIDPELSAKQLAFTEEMYVKRGMPQEAMDTALNMAKKFQKPIITAISGIFGGVIFGTIISLIVAIFVKKEGNPLIDTPEVK